jgi:hypothetical protein
MDEKHALVESNDVADAECGPMTLLDNGISRCPGGECKPYYDDEDIALVEWAPYESPPGIDLPPPTSNAWQLELVTGEKIVIQSQHDVWRCRENTDIIGISGNLQCPKCKFLYASVNYGFLSSRVPAYIEEVAHRAKMRAEFIAKCGRGRGR